jgi:UDP-N-acetylmuramoylalanine--D-glutamate ligase
VVAVDGAASDELRRSAGRLRAQGAEVLLEAAAAPADAFDLAVLSPGVPRTQRLVREVVERKVPMIGELELGYQLARCLSVAITGTNGKTTTTELVERILLQTNRKTVAAGNIGKPLCAVVDQSVDYDFLTLEVSSFQLETIQYFRPAVAVLMNLTPDHLDRYDGMEDYIRAKARIFTNQQWYDWAIVQSEALAQLRALKVPIPSKVISFSATDPAADIFLDRGWIISRVEGEVGPWLEMGQCRLRGPHNAENLMAALAVGRVLRLPPNLVQDALKSYQPGPHRCELVAEIDGVQYVNDSKATNVDAVQKAVMAMPLGKPGQPNIWLIAGGKDKGFEYDEIGPILAQRVKGAFLIGETKEKIRAAWQKYTPCTLVDNLTIAVQQIAGKAVVGDVVLLSPACSSFDQFRHYQHRGEVFREAVAALKNTTDSGCISGMAQHNGEAFDCSDKRPEKGPQR